MANNKEPNVWISTLKLVAGACALIGLVWLALLMAEKYPPDAPSASTSKPTSDWGIANDSPIRSNR